MYFVVFMRLHEQQIKKDCVDESNTQNNELSNGTRMRDVAPFQARFKAAANSHIAVTNIEALRVDDNETVAIVDRSRSSRFPRLHL